MKKKKLLITLAALGTLAMGNNSCDNRNSRQVKKALTKSELIKLLRELPTTSEDSLHMGAMCYSPAIPFPIVLTCESCGQNLSVEGFEGENDYLKEITDSMKALGYDAKVELLCADCANQLLQTNGDDSLSEDGFYNIFYFKTKDQQDYHIAMSNNINDYEIVLAFLENKPTYKDSFGHEHLVKDASDVIKYMTGISE